jgi:hypothetical protein
LNAEEAVQLIGAGIDDNTSSAVRIGGGFSNLNAATSIALYTAANNTTTSGTIRMFIDSSGRVGIGTTSPSTLLHVNTGSDATAITVAASVATGGQLLIGTGAKVAGQQSIVSSGNGLDIGTLFGVPITFFTDGTANERARIDANGRLLVGTSTAISNVYVKAGQVSASATTPNQQFADTSNVYSGLSITKYSTAGYAGTLSLNTANSSSVGTNGAVANNWTTGVITFNGNDGTNFIPTAEIQAMVDGTPGANDMPGRLVFSTTADAASSPTERMRITSGGLLKVTNGSQPARYTNTTNHAIVSDTSNQYSLAVVNTNATNPYGVVIDYTGASPNGTSNEFLLCFDNASGGTTRASIRSNGGLANYSANNVNLSDRNAKKDIAPASGTWDCLKEWEIVNFRYKDQPDDADLNMGVIAQQVAESCPEVITVFQEATEDQPEKLGVKDQQMMWMAIKALQEAQLRIETLEAEVAALKAS